jgi:hypothetical protein
MVTCRCARAGILVRDNDQSPRPTGGCLSGNNRPPRWPAGEVPRRGFDGMTRGRWLAMASMATRKRPRSLREWWRAWQCPVPPQFLSVMSRQSNRRRAASGANVCATDIRVGLVPNVRTPPTGGPVLAGFFCPNSFDVWEQRSDPASPVRAGANLSRWEPEVGGQANSGLPAAPVRGIPSRAASGSIGSCHYWRTRDCCH